MRLRIPITSPILEKKYTILYNINMNNWVINLPYTSLDPYMSSHTLSVHYNDHHKKYAHNLYNLLPPEEIELSIDILMNKYANTTNKAIYNNLYQIFCHNFFWEGLQQPDNTVNLSGDILKFKTQILSLKDEFILSATKLFGSGYVWICVNSDNKLIVVSTNNADIPNSKILFCIDIWEHAYYIDYQSQRKTFVENLFNYCINWSKVYQRYIQL